MERILVVVFDSEKKAYAGSHALNQLDEEGSITIHAETIIQKNADGAIAVKKAEDDFPVRTLSGSAVGSLIGLLGGPAGVAVGFMLGSTAGLVGDAYVAGVSMDFVDEVSAQLAPGTFAVIAEVSEEWITPVDSTMESLGGVVFRSAKASVEAEQRARDIAELKSEIAELKSEHQQAKAEAKARIQAKIDALNTRLHAKVAAAKQRAQQIKAEGKAKVEALRTKAAKARAERKAWIDAQITEIDQAYAEADVLLRKATAEELRKADAQLEQAR